MEDTDALLREIAVLRDRLSRLSQSSMRINESLELEAVLQGVLDSARSLTDAHYAVITTLDGEGRPEDYLASGLTADQSERLWSMPDRMVIFDYLNTFPGGLRVPDFAAHLHASALPDFDPPMSVSAMLMTPVRHRGERVGAIYVGRGRPGEAFTDEDEATLQMFASQAALVIANARQHRDEQRARADLEALLETSPVGVAVFDARTGAAKSLNREARRMVSALGEPGQSLEEFLRVLVAVHADGREVTMGELFSGGWMDGEESMRAAEITLRVPGGRSLNTLMNATPIHSQDGEFETLVVTLQDMTPGELLEQRRAEFLAMVSHELRAPLTSIRGSATTLLDAAEELDPAEMRQFFRIILEQADNMRELIGDLLDVSRIETGTLPVAAEPQEVADLVDGARNNFLTGGGRHALELDLPGDLPPVLADRRRIVQVLGNLLDNAARSSPESSPIRVSAAGENRHVVVSVTDVGSGIPGERLPLLFRKFSRAEEDDGGRDGEGAGLGLAIAKGIVEAHGGRIWAESDGPGLGARFTFTLPALDRTRSAARAAAPSAPPAETRDEGGRTRILTVDDDPHTLRNVRDALTAAGYEAIGTADAEQLESLIKRHRPHLVLLDLMLPGADGISLMESVTGLANVPVIFLSAYGRDQVIARALQSGAVDYVVKPFSTTELVARIQAALRRRTGPAWAEPAEPYQTGDLRIDFLERQVSVAGEPVQLTDTEYRLLVELSTNAGRVLTHDHLLQRVWGLRRSGGSGPVRTVVKNLRHKLGDNARKPAYILTLPRVGYRMPRPESEAPAEA